MPPDQKALFEEAARESPDNTVLVPWEVFRDNFMQDADPEDARSVYERLVPQPFLTYVDRLDLAEFYALGLPASYIVVEDDLALPVGYWHPRMSSRLEGCKILTLTGSHEVMFTRPRALTDRILEASHE